MYIELLGIIKHYNRDALINLLNLRIPIETYLEYDDPDMMWEVLYDTVHDILCPYRRAIFLSCYAIL